MADYQSFVKDYRLGLSKNYMKNYEAKDNYPDYSKHQCTVGRHLTLEVRLEVGLLYDKKRLAINGLFIIIY